MENHHFLLFSEYNASSSNKKENKSACMFIRGNNLHVFSLITSEAKKAIFDNDQWKFFKITALCEEWNKNQNNEYKKERNKINTSWKFLFRRLLSHEIVA